MLELILLSMGHTTPEQQSPSSRKPQLTALDTQDNHVACAPLRTKIPYNTHALDVSHITRTDENCIFYIQKLLKTPRPGKHLGRLEFRNFDEDKKMCIVTVLKEYVHRTKLTRGNYTQLLLSYCKPFKPVSTDTIACWLKKGFRECWN